ncbi:MAG TPA: helix-turn-helix domain-containing protein, partial [Streptosporangiaceae bacterium]|nr:helix-turn-helix domain-containing protein [Streptosporangiaceae bacterium]
MPNKVPENLTLADLRGRNFATVSEAAAILNLDPKTVRRGCESGSVNGTRIEGVWRISVAWLRERA